MVHSNCFERFFYVKISALGRSVSLFFCHANAKLAPRHWTKIVLENIANSRFRSSTVGSLLYHYNINIYWTVEIIFFTLDLHNCLL